MQNRISVIMSDERNELFMNNRVRSVLEHMLEDTQDAINFANDAGSIEVFSSSKMIWKRFCKTNYIWIAKY